MGSVLLIVLSVFLIIDSVLLVLAILLQEDKSGGGLGIVGGSSTSFFGASSGSILGRITVVLLTIFILLIIVMGLISSSFTKGSTFTAQDIYDAEANEYNTSVIKSLSDLPRRIAVSDFDNNVLAKISDEADKTFILTVYEKNKQNKYYEVNEKAVKNKDTKDKALAVLNSVGFTLEATAVQVGSELSNDESETEADTTND